MTVQGGQKRGKKRGQKRGKGHRSGAGGIESTFQREVGEWVGFGPWPTSDATATQAGRVQGGIRELHPLGRKVPTVSP